MTYIPRAFAQKGGLVNTPPKKRVGYGGNNMSENARKEHKELKIRAKWLLLSQGYTTILEEYAIPNPTKDERWRSRSVYYIDVVGIRDGEVEVPIECGGVRQEKLEILATMFPKILVWPYGSDFPYEWKSGTKVCRECGHQLGSPPI